MEYPGRCRARVRVEKRVSPFLLPSSRNCALPDFHNTATLPSGSKAPVSIDNESLLRLPAHPELATRFRQITEIQTDPLPFLAFPGIEFVLSMDSGKIKLMARPVGPIGKRTAKKSAKKTGRKPLKSHEIAKLDISGPNDFNGLRGCLAKQNRFASEIYQFASEI